MEVFRFPTNVVMEAAIREFEIERDKLIGEEILPLVEVYAQRIRYDELDIVRGMTSPTNLKTDPKIDTRPGSTEREFRPCYFKETDVMDESEILEARAFGTLGGVVDVHEQVGRMIKDRGDKTHLRIEDLRWQALQGEITINENGVYVHETFPVQTYDALVDWDERDTATPLRDDNAVAQMFQGTGASADGAIAYCNQKTINWRLENTNADDLAQYRKDNTNLTFSIKRMNEIAVERGTPIYKVYDQGYNPEVGDFTKFIEDGKVVVIGKRQQKVGDIASTPSYHRLKNGQPAPGIFGILEVNGRANPGAAEISAADIGAGKNPRIEYTGGIYCGPRIKYPRSVVVMTVKH